MSGDSTVVFDYRPQMCKCDEPVQGTAKNVMGTLTYFCKTCDGIIGKMRQNNV